MGSDGYFQVRHHPVPWAQSPYASGTLLLYCSYNNSNPCGSSYDHYANAQVDQLLQGPASACSRES